MTLSKKIIRKLIRKVKEELDRDAFFSFCLKDNIQRYKKEFDERVLKEIDYIKESRIGKKISIKSVELACKMDEVHSSVKDPWTRKFIANKKIKKQKDVNKTNKKRSLFC